MKRENQSELVKKLKELVGEEVILEDISEYSPSTPVGGTVVYKCLGEQPLSDHSNFGYFLKISDTKEERRIFKKDLVKVFNQEGYKNIIVDTTKRKEKRIRVDYCRVA